jgi:hypothetical protein
LQQIVAHIPTTSTAVCPQSNLLLFVPYAHLRTGQFDENPAERSSRNLPLPVKLAFSGRRIRVLDEVIFWLVDCVIFAVRPSEQIP